MTMAHSSANLLAHLAAGLSSSTGDAKQQPAFSLFNIDPTKKSRQKELDELNAQLDTEETFLKLRREQIEHEKMMLRQEENELALQRHMLNQKQQALQQEQKQLEQAHMTLLTEQKQIALQQTAVNMQFQQTQAVAQQNAIYMQHQQTNHHLFLPSASSPIYLTINSNSFVKSSILDQKIIVSYLTNRVGIKNDAIVININQRVGDSENVMEIQWNNPVNTTHMLGHFNTNFTVMTNPNLDPKMHTAILLSDFLSAIYTKAAATNTATMTPNF